MTTHRHVRSLLHRFGGLALTLALFTPLTATLAGGAPTPSGTRSIFMNGTDISSSRSQDLKNVDIHINENGDIFIVAPHYQVVEEDSYIPLSKFVQGINTPAHKAPQPIAVEVTSPKAVRTATAPSADQPGMLPKAGQATVPDQIPTTTVEDAPPPALPDDAPLSTGTK